MAKTPTWIKQLSEVLGYQTTQITKKSARTGNTQQVDTNPTIEVVAMGEPEKIEKDGKVSYRYSIFDMKKNFEYKVSCPQVLKITGLKQVIQQNLTVGALQNGLGWYKANSIQFANIKKQVFSMLTNHFLAKAYMNRKN